MTKFSFNFEIVCNDCVDSELKEIENFYEIENPYMICHKIVKKFRCENCMNIFYVFIDTISTRFSLKPVKQK
ncbi:MAG: hypothetical protein U9O55_01840 [Patescibacteria group bacterium]|nr:hypothetical protein [Patescibacteria group bacterium]